MVFLTYINENPYHHKYYFIINNQDTSEEFNVFPVRTLNFVAAVESVLFSPEGDCIAVSTGTDIVIYRIDTDDDSIRYSKEIAELDDRCATFSPDGLHLGIHGFDGSIKMLDVLRTNVRILSEGPVDSLRFSPDSATIISATAMDRTIRT